MKFILFWIVKYVFVGIDFANFQTAIHNTCDLFTNLVEFRIIAKFCHMH